MSRMMSLPVATIVNNPATPPLHSSLTMDPSSLPKGKEKAPAAEIAFPVRRAPSYFDRYPRRSSHTAPQSAHQRHYPHGRTTRNYGASSSTLPIDLSSNSNFANGTTSTELSGRPADLRLSSSRYTRNDDLVFKPSSPRRRSRRVPHRSSGEHYDLTHLRISDSSSLTQLETPPQTPIDFSTPRPLFDPFSVVVSAPIPGVETMDALVDGMNSLGKDDLFMGSGGISARSKRNKDRFHPLHQPPLPTPPPGVTLGGGLRRRTSSKSRASRHDDGTDDDNDADADDDDEACPRIPKTLSARQSSRPRVTKPTSPPTAIVASLSQSTDGSPPPSPGLSRTESKAVAPSISEIIRTYAPPQQQARSRFSTARDSLKASASSHGHETVYEEQESDPEPVSAAEEAELVSRTSIDSIAEEVRKTLRNQTTSPVLQALSSQSSRSRHSFMSERSSLQGSPWVEHRRLAPNNGADPSDQVSSVDLTPRPTQSQAIAEYLRSVRLTTLLNLTRPPHASVENPLVVSLSDLGSSTGHPLVVFLGLGGVRYISGLYDEMAEYLGIRLITIDRWGIGRTEVPKSKSARGIPEWASAVEEILDLLHIDQCSVMAHSAGAPYALSFANKVPERVRGEILLLAPWVGGVEGAGYKWLKYVPTGILKTAQAAEWKIQAWMLGKPPAIAFRGIGYDVKSATPTPPNPAARRRSPDKSPSPISPANATRHPSFDSSVFSDYDDLRDFEGRFDSRSTLGARSSGSHRSRTVSESKSRSTFARKTSRGFLTRLKGGSNQLPPQSPIEKPNPSPGGRRLKALRSMGSLRRPSTSRPTRMVTMPPQVPQPLDVDVDVDVGLGFDAFSWTSVANPGGLPQGHPAASPECLNRRAAGRRSLSHTATTRSSPPSLVSSPRTSVPTSPVTEERASITATSAYQAALGNALIAAAHAESSRGTHSDLLQILNHDQQPWGFSYAAYPHTVRVWYGDRDEKIAENAVRWMERTMGPGRCRVQVVRGVDHGLMYRSNVVVEVLERVRDMWEGAL